MLSPTISPNISLNFNQISAQVLKDLLESKFSSIAVNSRNRISFHDIIPLEVVVSDVHSHIYIENHYIPASLTSNKFEIVNKLNSLMNQTKCTLIKNDKTQRQGKFVFKYTIDMSINEAISNRSLIKLILGFQNEVIEALCQAPDLIKK